MNHESRLLSFLFFGFTRCHRLPRLASNPSTTPTGEPWNLTRAAPHTRHDVAEDVRNVHVEEACAGNEHAHNNLPWETLTYIKIKSVGRSLWPSSTAPRPDAVRPPGGSVGQSSGTSATLGNLSVVASLDSFILSRPNSRSSWVMGRSRSSSTGLESKRSEVTDP